MKHLFQKSSRAIPGPDGSPLNCSADLHITASFLLVEFPFPLPIIFFPSHKNKSTEQLIQGDALKGHYKYFEKWHTRTYSGQHVKYQTTVLN